MEIPAGLHPKPDIILRTNRNKTSGGGNSRSPKSKWLPKWGGVVGSGGSKRDRDNGDLSMRLLSAADEEELA